MADEEQVEISRTGPQLSVGKQEAFEIFTRDHEDHVTIEDNRTLLRQRLAEARTLGVRVNEARDRINELKKQLEFSRRQRVAHGLMGNHAEVEEEPNLVEESLCRQIEREKETYKSAVGCLKALRTEIEHLQLLLQRAKVKLQRDFQQWWSQEASSLQASESEATTQTGRQSRPVQASSPAAPGFRAPCVSLTVRAPAGGDEELDSSSSSTFAPPLRSFIPTNEPSLRAVQDEPLDRRENPSSPLRALSSTELSSSSVPLTGDREADANILAFVRARQKLLSRTGPHQ